MSSRSAAKASAYSVAGLLITFDVCSLLFILAIYRFWTADHPVPLLRSLPGFLSIDAAVIMAAAVLGMGLHLQRTTQPLRRQALMTIIVNCGVIVFLAFSGEVALRVVHRLSVHWPALNIHLPILRNWQETSGEFRAALAKTDHGHAYHAFDPLLGWTVARSRRSDDGLYASSVEGLRSAQQGDVLFTWSPEESVGATGHSKPHRVALVGDSYTFGYEIRYDQTWSHLLGVELGTDFQVLNFGVIGYSVNQMRLKYEQDVKPTHPDIVIVGIISHDFIRDGYVYNFMPFPDMLSLPYARPRAVLRDAHLVDINTPLIAPKDIFAEPDVHELPYLDHDMAYDRFEWESSSSWQIPQRSFLFRFLTAWPPRSALAEQNASDVAIQELGHRILASLLESIRRDGATPIVVYFPDRFELDGTNPHPPHYAMLGPKIFHEAGIDFIDTTPCIESVPQEKRFNPGTHYAVASHIALSKCLPKMVLSRVSQN
jgi:hypothetical protein